jgi:hypothetical protein
MMNYIYIYKMKSWGSSVSIVSDYGLNDQEIGFWSPAGTKDFSSNLSVQTVWPLTPSSAEVKNE